MTEYLRPRAEGRCGTYVPRTQNTPRGAPGARRVSSRTRRASRGRPRVPSRECPDSSFSSSDLESFVKDVRVGDVSAKCRRRRDTETPRPFSAQPTRRRSRAASRLASTRDLSGTLRCPHHASYPRRAVTRSSPDRCPKRNNKQFSREKEIRVLLTDVVHPHVRRMHPRILARDASSWSAPLRR